MKQILTGTLMLLLMLGAGNLCAQLQGQAKIDSLLKELPKQKEDTNKVNVLNDISIVYRLINPDEGIKYGQLCLELATKLHWKKEIASANECLGQHYSIKSEYIKALSYFNEALKIYKELGDQTGNATTYGNIGGIYFGQGEFNEALESFNKALEIYEALGDNHGKAIVNGDIGSIYNAQSDYPRALEYYFKALKVFEELEDEDGVAYFTADIGNIYAKQGDLPRARENYINALKILERTGNKVQAIIITGNLGNVYFQQGEYNKALEYYSKGLKMAEEIGKKDEVASATENIGLVYDAQHNYVEGLQWLLMSVVGAEEIGDKQTEALAFENIGEDYIQIATPESTTTIATASVLAPMHFNMDTLIPKGRSALLHKAVAYFKKAIAINTEMGSLDDLQGCYLNLSRADSMLGDFTGAYYSHILYSLFKDSVFSQGNSVKIAKLELRKKIETDSLKSEHARRVADIKFRQQRNYTYMGMAGILALAIFSFYIQKERGKSERARNIAESERKKSDLLLTNILPAEVAWELKMRGTSEARLFDAVTVLFTDFVNFTQAGVSLTPKALVDELHTCFKTFDEITTRYNIEKIKTIGDAYLAVCGLPLADPKHAENIVRAAIEINAFMQDRLAKSGNGTFQIRLGIHSGSVVAGIVGVKKFAYDIWGDTVNTAARMEQNSEAGRINISQTTYELVKDQFKCEYRGEIEVKGKGEMKMYYVQ